MHRFALLVALLSSGLGPAHAEDKTSPSRIDSITRSARDLMPSMPAVSLPSMPDLSMPDFSDATGKLAGEFNAFTQQLVEALPILEQMGFEVSTFRVTWGLPPKARLRLKSSGNADLQKVDAIAAKANGSGLMVSAVISSAAMAKRIQNTMKMGTAYLDIDFAVPPRVSMKFVGAGASERNDASREQDDVEIACK